MGLIADIHKDLERGVVQLIVEYRGRLRSEAVGMCKDETQAEDLVFRTFERVLAKIDTYKEDTNLFGWMRAIMENIYRNDRRSPVIQRTKSVNADELEYYAGVDWSTDEQILNNSDSEAIRRAISELDPKYNRLLLMRYYDGFSLRQIADLMRLPRTTVSWRLHVAHRLLAGKLEGMLGRTKKPLAVLAAVLTFTFAAAAWFVAEDVRGTGVPPVQEEGNGGTGVSPVQSETVSEPKQEDPTPTPSNTTDTKKENTMNIKKIAAVSATLVGLSAAYPNQAMASSDESAKSFVWKGTGTTAEANRWSVGANWEGDVAPTADDIGCVISIPAATQDSEINNDIDDLQVGELNIASSDAFTLVGKPVALTETGTFTSATPNFRCEMPLVLAEGATNSFSTAKDLTNTFAPDTLRGKGGLKKIGDGRMTLEGDNTFEGDVNISAGYVTMTTANALGTWWKTVRIGYSYGNAVNKLESSSALKLTQAINFNYNLNFDYEGNFSISCPADTHLCGTIKGKSFALKAVSGSLYCDGDVFYTKSFAPRGGTVCFNGKISAPGATSMAITYGGSRACFYSTGNDLGSISLSQGEFDCYTNNVLSDRCSITADEYAQTTDMNGYDQVCGGLVSPTATFSKPKCHIISAGTTPCTLTLKPSDNCTGRMNLNGPLTLVVDSTNGKTQTLQNVACSMTGDIVVSNGCFKVGADSTFPNVPGVEIAAGGKLILVPGVNICDGGSILRRTTGGKLVLQDGARLGVNGIVKDGVEDTSAYGKTFCAPGAGVAGAEEADWIEGTGALVVKANTVTHEHTWSGGAGAGGDNESMQNPLNWGLAPTDPAPSLTDGTLLPTFATAGTNAWFEGGLMAKGVVFNAPDAFTLTARDPDGKVGVSELGVTATNKLVNTIDAAVELLSGQTWTANADTTVHVTRGITSEANYAFNVTGGGMFILEGDVAVANNINVSGSRLVLRNGEFTSTSGKIILQDYTAQLQLDNAVLSSPLSVETPNPQLSQLCTGAGTTNRIESPVVWPSRANMSLGKDSLLTIATNLTEGGTCTFSGADKDTSVLVITNGTLECNNPTFRTITVHFWSSGNAIGSRSLSADAMTQFFLHAENSLADNANVSQQGRVDLCGQSQRIGSINGGSTGTFYSKTPAVLSVNKSEGDAAFKGHFEGAVGLKKLSTGKLTLGSTNQTTGSLEVAGGEVALTSDATWDGTDISVTAADAKLTLQDPKNLVKRTVLKLTDATARVNVAAGVQARVRQMYVPRESDSGRLMQLSPGIYTSANSPYVTGEGSISVRGGGMILLVN